AARIGVTSISPALHGARVQPFTGMMRWSNSSGAVISSRAACAHVDSPTWGTSDQAARNDAAVPGWSRNWLGPASVDQRPPLRTTRVGIDPPDPFSISIPTYPYSVHAVFCVLATRNVSTMVPAAPCAPAKLISRPPVWQRSGPAGTGVAVGAGVA